MKTIKTNFTMIGMILFLSLTGCSKSGVFESPSTKIIGTWKIDKVKFLKDFSFSRTDVTDNFNQWTYTYNEDETLTISFPGVTLNGTWKIHDTYDPNTDYLYGTRSTLISAISNLNGTISIQNWNNFYVNNSKLTGEERRNGGTYYYTLIKL